MKSWVDAYCVDTQLAEMRAEITRLRELSVENIMLGVVPGPEGEGVEVWARSVEDVIKTLDFLSNKVDDLDNKYQNSLTRIHILEKRNAELKDRMAIYVKELSKNDEDPLLNVEWSF